MTDTQLDTILEVLLTLSEEEMDTLVEGICEELSVSEDR